MTSILDYLFIEVAALYRKKEISPIDVVKQLFQRMETVEPSLNAFISTFQEDALTSAQKAEKAFLTDDEHDLLLGIPYSLKDIYFTKGIKTTCGSRILKDFTPSYSATVVERLKQTGAILIGKTNMLEFAYGIVHPDYGQTNNPWNKGRTAGGSSGGSAASVAAGIGYFSLGTDTGGSIRIPASYCGVVGLKPTYGLVSTYGVFPLSWSLDHAGPIAKSVRETAVVLRAISGFDPKDRLSHHGGLEMINFAQPIKKQRIGILQGQLVNKLDPDVKLMYERMITLVVSLGWEVDIFLFQDWERAEKVLMDVLLPEATHIHQPYLAQRDDYSEKTFEQLELGMEQNAQTYLQGLEDQRLLKRQVFETMKEFDAVLLPTVAFPAPEEDPAIGDLELDEMLFTGLFNVTGHPALTFNVGITSENLPVGMQLVGGHFQEQELLLIADTIEQEIKFQNKNIKNL